MGSRVSLAENPEEKQTPTIVSEFVNDYRLTCR